MRKAKVKKIVLDMYGSFLGMEKGCFVVRNKHDKVQRARSSRRRRKIKF